MAEKLDKLVKKYVSSWPKHLNPVPNVDLWQGLHSEEIERIPTTSQSKQSRFTLRDALALAMIYVDGEEEEKRSCPTREWFELESSLMNSILETYFSSYQCKLANRQNAFFFPIVHTLNSSSQECIGQEDFTRNCVIDEEKDSPSNTLKCRSNRCLIFRVLQSTLKSQLRNGTSSIYDEEERRYHLFVRYKATDWVIMRITIEPLPVKVTVHIFDVKKDFQDNICPQVHKYAVNIACHLRLLEIMASITEGPQHQQKWANSCTNDDKTEVLRLDVHVLRHHAVLRRNDDYSSGHWAMGQILALLDAGKSEKELSRCVEHLQSKGVSYLGKLMLVDYFAGFMRRVRIISY